MSAALGWGALAASSLILGALLGLVHRWSDRVVGLVLAFGAGALISAVSFDLAQEGVKAGGGAAVGVGLAAGALTYFLADRALPDGEAGARTCARRVPGRHPGAARARDRHRDGRRGRRSACSPRSSSPTCPKPSGRRPACTPRAAKIAGLWIAVALVCTLATVLGYAVADSASGHVQAAINGFAAGALLVMLIDSMIPEARKKGKDAAGLVTVLGFAVAAALSILSS